MLRGTGGGLQWLLGVLGEVGIAAMARAPSKGTQGALLRCSSCLLRSRGAQTARVKCRLSYLRVSFFLVEFPLKLLQMGRGDHS